MRRAGYALLLLFAAAWCLPAYANVPCYGGTVVYAPTAEDCPKRISDVSITPTVGGFDLGYTSEGGVTLEIAVEAGHDQKCPGCPYSTNTSDLQERRINYDRLDDQAIKNATGMAVNSQQDASTAGNYSISITGLGNGADYSIHLLPIESDDDYGQAWQRNVTTLTAAGDTLLTGAQRYNKATGNDLADGLTHATAWQTGDNCESGLAVGTDCRFLAGDEFSNKLIISHDGQSSDPVVVGCYRWDGSDEVACVPGVDTRPNFKGALSDASITGLSYDFSSADLNSGMVQVNADWVTVDYVRVTNWEGRGFRVNGVNQGDGLASHIKFLNVETYATGWSPLTVENAYRVVVRGFDFELYNVCEGFERNGAPSGQLPAGAGNCGASGVPGGVSVVRNSDADEGQILIETGLVHKGWGEALNVLSSKKVILRNVRYGNVASGGPYCDACDDTVFENIIGWGNNNDCGLSCQGQTGGGQNGNVENSAVLGIGVKYVFRNSLLVGADRCHNITMGSNAITNGDQVEVYLYNNVCVNPSGTEDAYFNTFLGGNFNSSVITYKLRNYVLWDEALGSDGVDLGSDCDGNYNQWYVAQADTDCDGANDVIGAPSYPTAYATLSAKLSAASSPAFSDVAPTSAMSGDNSCYTEAIVDWTPDDYIWDEMVAPSDTTHDAWTKANWAAGCKWDALGNNYDGTDVQRGPVRYAP